MALGSVENGKYSFQPSLHPSLEKIQAVSLLKDLQGSYPNSIIEGCIPNYLSPDDLGMRVVAFTRTLLNRITHTQKNSRFLLAHSTVEAVALSSVKRDEQGVFGRMTGLALVARDTDSVDVLITQQSSGTWVRNGDLVATNVDYLNSIAQKATPMPVYLPHGYLLNGRGIGFPSAHTIKIT